MTPSPPQSSNIKRLWDPTESIDLSQFLIVHVAPLNEYQNGHITGALALDVASLTIQEPPHAHKIASAEQLSAVFNALGLTSQSTVLVYDNDYGMNAGRLIWTLDVIGHHRWAYLNGGLTAWQQLGLELSLEPQLAQSQSTPLTIEILNRHKAELETIYTAIDDQQSIIWDARSIEEYNGSSKRAKRAGHIPGAIHYEWSRLLDEQNNFRLRPLEQIRTELEALGMKPDVPIITHCQSHRRSSLCYLAGRLLDLNISAYHGSWAEWGNDPDTPIQTI